MSAKHMTSDQLSALVDGALAGRALEEAERHLGACASCREALGALSAQEDALRRALTHEPGEAYFERFADRVGERIRAEGLAGAQRRGEAQGPSAAAGPPSQRSLAWVGAVAAVVVAVGITFLTTRETNVVPLRDERAIERAERATRVAPPAEVAPPGQLVDKAKEGKDVPLAGAQQGANAPLAGARHEAAPPSPAGGEAKRNAVHPIVTREGLREAAPAPATAPSASGTARPGRAQEVRRDERGEDVPVSPPRGPAALFARPPEPATPPAAPGEPVTVKKHAPALPMKTLDQSPARNLREVEVAPPAPGAAAEPRAQDALSAVKPLADSDAKRAELCGEVRDPSGRPVAGASVVLAETGGSAATDARGRFCIAVPPGDRTLTVLAVGFVPARHSVRAGAGAPEASVVLEPVEVLGRARWKGFSGFSAASPGPIDLFDALSDSLRAAARGAQQLTSSAERLRSAEAFDRAARSWTALAPSMPGGPVGSEARFQLAAARVHAWELGSGPERKAAAAAALDAYLARAPMGAHRDQARAWRARLGR